MRQLMRCTIAPFIFLSAFSVSGAETLPDTTNLSLLLGQHCRALSDLTPPNVDSSKVTCTAIDDSNLQSPEITQCRKEVWAAIEQGITALIIGQGAKPELDFDTFRKNVLGLDTVKNDSGVIQRLDPVLTRHEENLKAAIAYAVEEVAWKDLDIQKGSGSKLKDRALDAAQKNADSLKAAVKGNLVNVCIADDPLIVEAISPKKLTVAEEAASTKAQVAALLADAERKALAEFTKSEGFARSVECIWGTITEDGQQKTKLTCKPSLLLSGEQVSEIRILGLPRDQIDVTVISSDSFKGSVGCTNTDWSTSDLTCDHLSFPTIDPLGARPVVLIAVHTNRNFFPSWGARWGSLTTAKKILRASRRKKLSIVSNGATPTVNVTVQTRSDQASASIPVGFARWKVDSGGFVAFTPLVDHEIVTTAGADSSHLNVIGIRRSDKIGQDSGVFANFVPQNYQVFGVSLGFTTSDRRPSVYLGPNVRLLTFGNEVLASAGVGLAMRSVLRFPDLHNPSESHPIPVSADSVSLKGTEQYRLHFYIAVNLGFRIGAFGSAATQQ